MSDVEITCPNCRAVILIDHTERGKLMQCPSCRETLNAPPVMARPSPVPAAAAGEQICTNCGTIGKPMRQVQGQFAVEVLLWCLFIVPGLIYSAWRYMGKSNRCPVCEQESMIPLDSPRGRQLFATLPH
jgi:predicted Zn finger-like uncharacterized protein